MEALLQQLREEQRRWEMAEAKVEEEQRQRKAAEAKAEES